MYACIYVGFPGGTSGKELACQCRRHKRHGFNQLLGQEDLLKEGLAAHSSILAWRIPWIEQLGKLQSIGSQRRCYLPCCDGAGCHDLCFFGFFNSLMPGFSLSSFTLIKRLSRSSSFSAIRVVSFASPWLLMFLPPILIPACGSGSPAFLTMCSTYRLSKQDASRQLSFWSIPLHFSSVTKGWIALPLVKDDAYFTCDKR